MKMLAGIMAFIISVVTVGSSSLPTDKTDIPKDEVTETVIEQTKNEPSELKAVSNAAVTDFSVRLFKNSAVNGKNTLISPLSVLVALSMTANGADNETLSQMETVLGMPIDELNTWVCDYMKNLPNEEKYKLSIANSIWLNDTPAFKVSEEFIKNNTEKYSAGIYKLPFDSATLDRINKWVEDNTDGMIKDILDDIAPQAVMYLVNAIAFDAEWQKIYEPYQMNDGEFTTESGEKRNIKLMYSKENLYIEDERAVGFIKYYKGGKYAFAALLPNEGVKVDDYIKTLDGKHLNELLTNAQSYPVNAALPKFESEYRVEMQDILAQMGMPDAFSGSKADFSRMGKYEGGNISIDKVIHQTFISVDAEGTRAGAATVVGMKATSARPGQPPKQVYLDRPFVYMLFDCETGIPFFIGTAMDIAG